MSWLTAIGLCVAGLAAIIVEFFVPAAGIIGLAGFGSIVGGVGIAYSEYGPVVGSTYLISMVILTPGAIALYFKFFPRSAVGRWLILSSDRGTKRSSRRRLSEPSMVSEGPIDSPEDATGKAVTAFPETSLLGREGTTISVLRPSGSARIEGRRLSVVTGGEFVGRGERIVVTRVEGNQIRVRARRES